MEPERQAFLVVKARRLSIKDREQSQQIEGSITDFFPLMGDIDYISSENGLSDQYVLCWFDDDVDDLNLSWRRMTGVKFAKGASFKIDKKGKRTYNAIFKAKRGKTS
jgi:hypothetical protein